MPIAGAAAGAGQALERIMAEQMLQAQMLQRQREAQAQQQLQRDQFTETQKQHEITNTRQQKIDDQHDADRRQSNNIVGVRRMIGDSLMQRQGPLSQDDLRGIAALQVEAGDTPNLSALMPQTPKRTVVTTIGKRGEAVKKAFTDDELAAGVPEYREPQKPNAADKPKYERVVVNGKETFMTPEEVRQMGGVDASSRKRPSTGMQQQTVGYYNRMKDALDTMDGIEQQLTENDVMLINNSPLPDLINNRLLSQAGQQYAQALRTYTEARLRKESGAAIQQFEYENDRKAISRQSGDKEETLHQKKHTRRKTAEGIAFSAGPAYEEYYGEPFQRLQNFDVTDPNGKVHHFDNEEQAVEFKKRAGIR